MEHNDYKKMIQFYLYEELDLQNKKIFEEHLNSCNECKQELESYKKLFTEIKNDSDAPLNPKLLMEARLELRGLLKSERNRVSTSTKIYEKIASLITRPIGMALSGVSILFVGLFLGYIVFKSPAILNENPYKKDSKNWIFLEIEPGIDFPIERDYDATPLLSRQRV